MSDLIPPEFQQFVEHELAWGNYQSLQELIGEGLRLLRERKLEELRKELDKGLAELDRGEGIEINSEEELRAFFEDIKVRGRERLEAAKRQDK
jgi:antitoxin ParD1/3/4